ncbi:UPF0158 family protein [Vibrio porteresiae]|uniref:UPF0158 family protein n=1 Tax=Vibrio porteresiae DSM 19223 TaxID=1123496 RepID=A0ABZ0QKI7_9VIBR|nr:UPF0158 family protein [Vibrio porteresiae]WPC75931.1 UPF0158 family protein [Vibrio porteresiae DSM 19223]
MKIDLDNLELAVDFVSGGSIISAEAYLDKETGNIFYLGDGVDEEAPENINSARYLEIPNSHELNLGRSMVLEFIQNYFPEEYELIRSYFNKRGAFSKFKERLEQIGALEQWYSYEALATKRALKEWCDENSISYSDHT